LIRQEQNNHHKPECQSMVLVCSRFMPSKKLTLAGES